MTDPAPGPAPGRVPPLSVRWFLPMGTDTAYVGEYPESGPPASVERLVATARAAEVAGCTGMLVPTAYVNELDPLSVVAAVLSRTRRISLLVAVRQNQYHPVQAAMMLGSLATLFPGRIEVNVVTGGWGEDAWIGDETPQDQRGRRLAEWLDLFGQVLRAESKTAFEGAFYRSNGAIRSAAARVPIALSGSSPAAMAALAEHGDHYLTYLAPLEEIRRQCGQVALGVAGAVPGSAAPSVVVRAHLVVRETESQAWAAAEDLLSRADPRVLATVRRQRTLPGSQRSAQVALVAAAPPGELRVGPNLWAGVGTARYGAALALVGAPDRIADRIAEYRDAGVGGFILSGYPKLEECERYGRLLAPVLRQRGLIAPEQQPTP